MGLGSDWTQGSESSYDHVFFSFPEEEKAGR